MQSLTQLVYLALWFFRARFLGRRNPLQSVVFVTNGCDSTCRHCTQCTRPTADTFKPLADISDDLDYCYAQGARLLDIEGARLLRWHDGEHRPADIFKLAHSKGFYSISTMIPAADYAAWQRSPLEVDLLWVSVMSLKDCTLLEEAKDLSILMVVNANNVGEVPAILEFVQSHPAIRQIAFNFHTPFAGSEASALSPIERKEVIHMLMDRKQKGYRIMNSRSGLHNMLFQRFHRHCWICNFIYCDGRRSPQCLDDPTCALCSQCGFSMAGEMSAVFSFRPDTLLAGLGGRSSR